MRLPLIDGQGNFGSVDGDPPAADALHRGRGSTRAADGAARRPRQGHGRFPARTTTARSREPIVLPARFPESAGQRRRRHRGRHGDQHPAAQSRRGDRRLRAPISTTPRSRSTSLIEIVPGPDFPTGGAILGRSGIRAAYHDRPRLDRDARARPRSRRSARSARRSSSPRSPIR